MKHPSNEDGRREGRPDAPHGVLSDGQGGSSDGFLSRTDFEAALPLYVGGELDSDECARVDSWLAEHAEDRYLLEAASVSRSLLQGHAASLHAAPVPDLWAGIRGELASAGLLATGHGHQSRSEHARPRHGARAPRAVRWYERRSLAAAAAVLVFGGLGAMLWKGEASGTPDASPSVVPELNSGFVAEADASTTPAIFTGTESVPADARLAGTKRGVRLRRATGTADHILDRAVPVRLEQAQLPELQGVSSSGSNVKLTGGR